MRKIVFLIISLFYVDLLEAQTCGTIATNDQLEFMAGFKGLNKLSSRTQAIKVQIPIQFHFVVRDDGSGGISIQDAENLLDKVNSYYDNSDIEFFFNDEVNFINDSDNFNWDSNEGAIASGNDVVNVVNVYFLGSINNNGRALCGYTRFPPSSDRVFVAYSCAAGSGTTLEHELGHYFTLFHTHGTTNTGTTDELVDGSNCENAGDRLCDTPADPNLSGVVSNCVYIGNATDANGQIYNPQVENIMSYAPDQCVDLFTPDQYDRIRNGFENGRSYLNWISDGFTANFSGDKREICKEDKVKFTGTGFGVTSWSWEFEGGDPARSTQQSPSVTYNEGGIFDVRLTVRNNVGEVVVINKNNYVTVIDPLQGARSDTLDLNFDLDLGQLNVVNPDLSITFNKSDVDYDNSPTSGSLFVNNYDYLTETPFNIDEINTGALNNAGVNKYKVSFDYAYTYRSGSIEDQFIYDTLKVGVNTGCLSEDIFLFEKGGSELASSPVQDIAFIPSSKSEWRKVEFEYQLEGEETSIFKFFNVSYNGNNLYIDNVKIIPDLTLKAPELFRVVNFADGVLTIRWVDLAFNELNYILLKSVDGNEDEIVELEKNAQIYLDNNISDNSIYSYSLFALGRDGVTSDTIGPITFDNTVTSLNPLSEKSDLESIIVYPTPAESIVKIKSELEENILSLELIDQTGRIIIKQSAKGFGTNIDVSNVKAGMYFVQINFKNKSITKRVIIEK